MTMQQAIQNYREQQEAKQKINADLLEHRLWLHRMQTRNEEKTNET
jgi:hypothetical protein